MSYVNITATVKTLVYISLACTLISAFVCKTRFGGSVRYLCGISVLVALTTVLSPFLKSLGQLLETDFSYADDDGDGNAASDELIINQSAAYICEYIKSLISQRFSLSRENISVSVTVDTEDRESIIIKNVTASFINTDESLYPEIARYISDTVGCECIVISKQRAAETRSGEKAVPY